MSAPARENRFGSAGGSTGARQSAFGVPRGGVAEPEETPPSRAKAKSKKKMIVIAALVLVVGGAAFMFLKPKPVEQPKGGEYVALEAQTLNLAGGHYLKIGVSVQVIEGKVNIEEFDSSKASALLIEEFADRRVDSVASNAAREKLLTEYLAMLKKAYPDEIWDVSLTQFVTQ